MFFCHIISSEPFEEPEEFKLKENKFSEQIFNISEKR